MKTYKNNLLCLLICLLSIQVMAQNEKRTDEQTFNIDCRTIDSLALLALYEATDGLNWTNKWDLNSPMSTWYGVSLNIDGCVDSLVLSNNNLNGVIPPEIGNLASLKILNLSSNNNCPLYSYDGIVILYNSQLDDLLSAPECRALAMSLS